MKNNNIARMVISGICLVLSILWMCEIYLLSDKVADDSAKQSMGIGRIVAELVVAGFDDMTEQEQLEVLEKLDFPVRKAAHMTE